MQSVATLIDASSAARQIEASGVQAARERRDNARLIHREAALAARAGDTANATRLLNEATREMMAGARLAKPEEVTGEKTRRDFDARLESARALLVAQQRIAQEKGNSREATDAARSIHDQIARAEQQVAAGQTDVARTTIDRAYLTARVSIESMRRGDTLVRSLAFASKREEYDYEIDRNETHRMLITVLLSERKDASGAMPADMKAHVDRAAQLRGEAEQQGRRGDHESAVRTLEDSTRELVRAIRMGGIYIPG